MLHKAAEAVTVMNSHSYRPLVTTQQSEHQHQHHCQHWLQVPDSRSFVQNSALCPQAMLGRLHRCAATATANAVVAAGNQIEQT